MGHSLLQCTAGIRLWCVYDVQVESEGRSAIGTVTTPITELKSCAESPQFSYTPITWICMAIMNHGTDHDPLMETQHSWKVGLRLFPGLSCVRHGLCFSFFSKTNDAHGVLIWEHNWRHNDDDGKSCKTIIQCISLNYPKVHTDLLFPSLAEFLKWKCNG